MKKFKLKNKLISIFGAAIILGAFLASIFSSFFVFDNQKNNKLAYADDYDYKNYTEYASNVVDEISNNISALPLSYSLKDDYLLLAENQVGSDLCWAYAGSKAFETALMINTGEYYNFSEAATAYFAYKTGRNNMINSKSSFSIFDATIRECGLVGETNFSNDMIRQINNENYQNYSYVEKFAEVSVISTFCSEI